MTDLWPYFLAAAPVLFLVDRAMGLAHILTGFAIVFLCFGVAGAAGIDLSDHEAVVEIIVALVFTPIFLRLFFVLASRGGNRPVGTVPPAGGGPGGRGDRNAGIAYRGVVVAGTLVPLFTFHFVTGGLALVAVATLLGWVPPDGTLLAASMIACPYAAAYIADARGASGVGKILWGVAGLVFGAMFAALVTVAAMG